MGPLSQLFSYFNATYVSNMKLLGGYIDNSKVEWLKILYGLVKQSVVYLFESTHFQCAVS